MKKSQIVLVSLLLLFGLTVSAIAGGQTDTTSSAGGSADEIQLGGNGYPPFDDLVFPEALPVKPPLAPSGTYAYTYDNMEERYSIEIVQAHYGQPTLPAEDDPINVWLSEKFNIDISLTTMLHSDRETVVTTRFAAGDPPDIADVTRRDIGFALNSQGLLVDAKNIYPLMPHWAKYATDTMIKWSTNPDTDEIAFLTHYVIKEGVWGFAIRKDWMETYGMD
jgi:ABC-type glycerol-3-phosphate transport system substrate-binding protein